MIPQRGVPARRVLGEQRDTRRNSSQDDGTPPARAIARSTGACHRISQFAPVNTYSAGLCRMVHRSHGV